MHVAYLLKKFPRLSETFVLNEILAQERLGARIHVLSRRPADPEPRHPQVANLRAAVEVLDPTLGMAPWLRMFGPLPEDRRLLERFGALVREMSTYGHPRLPALFGEALHVLERTRALGIEHVHVHFATDSAIVAMLLHDLGGVSYSITAHAKDIYRTTVDARLLSRMVERSSFTVTVCDANVRWLAGLLPPAAMARVRRLYNGVDLQAFRPDRRARDEGHVLSVGRLVEKKGFDVLFRALALLRDRGVACRATIVGEGEERSALEALVRELSLSDRVTLTGALDQEAVRAEMSRATIFCQPCRVGQDGNQDALPTSLLESIASGLPCVSTPVGGIPEILDEGRVGVLVPEDDPEATAEAIERLLRDSALRAEFARAGRSHAERTFDAVAVAKTLRSWFEDAARNLVPA
ncbi:MAG: glycosyltransferase family 4 protein [Planctomycetota bacterium]